MRNSLVVGIYSKDSKISIIRIIKDVFKLEPTPIELPISEEILESLETFGKLHHFKLLTNDETFEQSVIGLLNKIDAFGPVWKTQGIKEFPENSKTFLLSVFKQDSKIYSETINGITIHLEKGDGMFNNL